MSSTILPPPRNMIWFIELVKGRPYKTVKRLLLVHLFLIRFNPFSPDVFYNTIKALKPRLGQQSALINASSTSDLVSYVTHE